MAAIGGIIMTNLSQQLLTENIFLGSGIENYKTNYCISKKGLHGLKNMHILTAIIKHKSINRGAG